MCPTQRVLPVCRSPTELDGDMNHEQSSSVMARTRTSPLRDLPLQWLQRWGLPHDNRDGNSLFICPCLSMTTVIGTTHTEQYNSDLYFHNYTPRHSSAVMRVLSAVHVFSYLSRWQHGVLDMCPACIKLLTELLYSARVRSRKGFPDGRGFPHMAPASVL